MKPVALIAVAAVGLASLPLALAHAYELEPAKWRTRYADNPFRSRSHVSNGRFVVDGGTLAARGQKPNGGYYYSPVCKTSDGRIGAATPTTFGSTWGWECLGGSGELIKNGSDFTWEYKGQVQNRGSISIYSLTYEVNGQQRVICKGRIGTEEMPGYFVLPSAGGVPSACQVTVMGQLVPATTYYVAKHRVTGSNQPTVSNGAGWIERPNYNKGAQAEPLYRTTTRDGSKVLCRAQQNGKWWPGVLVSRSFGSNKPGFACSAFTGTSTRSFFDYEVYVSSKSASKFGWEKYGTQTNYSGAVVVDEGTNASNRRHACQIGNTVGYVEPGTKKCKYQRIGAGATKFRTHMK